MQWYKLKPDGAYSGKGSIKAMNAMKKWRCLGGSAGADAEAMDRLSVTMRLMKRTMKRSGSFMGNTEGGGGQTKAGNSTAVIVIGGMAGRIQSEGGGSGGWRSSAVGMNPSSRDRLRHFIPSLVHLAVHSMTGGTARDSDSDIRRTVATMAMDSGLGIGFSRKGWMARCSRDFTTTVIPHEDSRRN
jgi:hypothetical protein